MNIELLNQAAAFVSLEADLLDHSEYTEWLNLWEESGTYIVPAGATMSVVISTGVNWTMTEAR